MDFRTLGSRGPDLTTIGFGCWAMGGAGWAASWGRQDDRQSEEAIHVALDRGVNWFDTAAVYGLGHSEEVLGRALGQRRDQVIVATKFGLVWDRQGNIRNSGSRDSVLRECDASLKRLGIDYIDLYQMHWPDDTGTPVEETIQALDDLVKQGKIRYVGVSNFDVPLLKRALSIRHIDSVQPPYSLLSREVESELLPFCRGNGIGVVAYSPLASGLLGGKYTADQTFEAGDWRAESPEFRGEGLRHNLEIVEGLRAIADQHGRSVAQLAVAWVLSNPAVTSAIVGVRRADHLTGVLDAANWHLDATTLDQIEKVMAIHQPTEAR
ncbi:MAG: aldo/keto reductase [Chloroflexota bacterium]